MFAPASGDTSVGAEGGAPITVKPLVRSPTPPGVVTDTSRDPVVACAPMEMLTVICVGLSTVKLLTVMSEPKLTDVASVKFVPVMVTLRLCPWMPWLGFTELMVQAACDKFTEKAPALVPVPAGVVTDTSLGPIVALLSMVILPVIWVELFTTKLLIVIPEPKLTEVASAK